MSQNRNSIKFVFFSSLYFTKKLFGDSFIITIQKKINLANMIHNFALQVMLGKEIVILGLETEIQDGFKCLFKVYCLLKGWVFSTD